MFWEIVNELPERESKQCTNPIRPSQWLEHFQKLLNQPGNFNEPYYDFFIAENKDLIFNKLNLRINELEVKKAIAKLTRVINPQDSMGQEAK